MKTENIILEIKQILKPKRGEVEYSINIGVNENIFFYSIGNIVLRWSKDHYYLAFIGIEERFRGSGYSRIIIKKLFEIIPQMQYFKLMTTLQSKKFWKHIGIKKDKIKDFNRLYKSDVIREI